jgi:isopenicillin N synthase-like dioxygenase
VEAATLGSVKGPQAAFTEIPMIDVSALFAADTASRLACGREIGRACRDVGFFYAVNHGIAQPRIDEVFAMAERFFALPEAEKMAIALARSPFMRGYFPLEGEVLDRALGADYKEGFDMALDLPLDDPDVVARKPLHGPNQWPARPPEFRRVVQRYFDDLIELGRLLSRGFALSLDLPEDFFTRRMQRPTAILRLLRYPPNPRAAAMTDGQLGCGAHSDYGYLTILAQDEVGGLQVQNRAGKWIDAKPVPGAYVCNIGDMMAQWTNDRFAATQHRVISSPDRERYSIPFFFHPDFDTEVACLPSCQSADNPPRYAPTTTGAHILQRLQEAYVG